VQVQKTVLSTIFTKIRISACRLSDDGLRVEASAGKSATVQREWLASVVMVPPVQAGACDSG